MKAYILAYLLYRFATEFIRPEPRVLAGLTAYQWAAVEFLPVFVWLWRRDRIATSPAAPQTAPLPDPKPPAPALEHKEPGPLAQHSASAIPAKPRPRMARAKWAELLKRVYQIDVLTCPCGGKRSLTAAITDHEVIVKILDHLGLPSEPPQVTPARAPPHYGDDGLTEGRTGRRRTRRERRRAELCPQAGPIRRSRAFLPG